jgi:hypothetical protein
MPNGNRIKAERAVGRVPKRPRQSKPRLAKSGPNEAGVPHHAGAEGEAGLSPSNLAPLTSKLIYRTNPNARGTAPTAHFPQTLDNKELAASNGARSSAVTPTAPARNEPSDTRCYCGDTS